jgi:membrane protease YdiL (CAAX protease family)
MTRIAPVLALGLPLVLLLTTLLVFRAAGRALGPRRGYFAGFLFYWLVGCLLLPVLLVDPPQLAHLFRAPAAAFGSPAWVGAACLLLPLVLGYGYAFPRAVRRASLAIMLASLALAAVNATLEEVLWRGLFVRLFPGSFVWAVVFPAIGLGLWHIAPQTLTPNKAPGGSLSFVIVAAVLGLMWGWVAFATGSILWTTVSHILFDFSGLGASLYLGPHALPMRTAASASGRPG